MPKAKKPKLTVVQKTKTKKKNKGGRPSDYKPEYCQALMDHMAEGYSFESFAATIGKHRDTLYEWEKVHPAFSDSKKKGRELGLLEWEKIGKRGITGKIPFFNNASYIFTMKNRFPDLWYDKHQVDLGKNGIQLTLAYNTKKDGEE